MDTQCAHPTNTDGICPAGKAHGRFWLTMLALRGALAMVWTARRPLTEIRDAFPEQPSAQ
ncbi:MAG: hypothetical protein FJ279_12555 [Planctomycetes bacterium]|nr:hypothetical protein [Planctomycetota bacterium]